MTPVWLLPQSLWNSLGLTLELAAITTALLMLLAVPLGWYLAATKAKWGIVAETILAMPLVLPPTVIGFYLLVFFAPHSLIGDGWQRIFGQTLPFSFAGLVVGSCIYSLPFATQPVIAAFRMLRIETAQAAYSLGMSRWQTFRYILLPLARSGVYSGAVLAFAHTIGEFGVVLMVGGNIPGITRVASIALYDETQKLNYPDVHGFALVLVALSFALLFIAMLLQKRQEHRQQSAINHK